MYVILKMGSKSKYLRLPKTKGTQREYTTSIIDARRYSLEHLAEADRKGAERILKVGDLYDATH